MKILGFKQFINEGGVYTGDLVNLPIKALQRSKKTRGYKILEFIFNAGIEGTRYTDIVKFVVQDLNGDTYDHSIHRGWYSDALNGMGKPGLLQLYCKKLENGNWALNEETRKFFEKEDELYGKLTKDSFDLLSKLLSKKSK